MLSKLIINSYELLIEIALWLFLVVAFIGVWSGTGSFFAGIGGLIAGFVFAVLFGGGFLVLNDIRKRVKLIEEKSST